MDSATDQAALATPSSPSSPAPPEATNPAPAVPPASPAAAPPADAGASEMEKLIAQATPPPAAPAPPKPSGRVPRPTAAWVATPGTGGPGTGTRSFRIRTLLGGTVVRDDRFEKDSVTIGREPACDIHLDNPAVSRRHAAIVRNGDVFALVDKKTDNRSMLNGKPAGELTLLNNGDEILVGKFTLKFEAQTSGMFAVAENVFNEDQPIDKLGGSTLKMTTSTQKKLVKERGRVKGFAVLQNKAGQTKAFIAEGFVVGKSSDSDLKISGFFAPRRALVITRGMDDYRLYNVSPKPEYVTVNGKPVSNFVVLSNNDKIEAGGQTFSFVIQSEEEPAK